MVWIYTTTAPEPVERKTHLGMRQRTVNYNIVPLGENDPSGYKYRHQAVTLEPSVWNYDAIVDAIITAEYPADKMQAVINNYLLDSTDKEAIDEMNAMQAWRARAKEIARQALAEIPAERRQGALWDMPSF